MIYVVIVYFLTLIIVNIVLTKCRFSYSPITNLKLTSRGLEFFSQKRHRLKIESYTYVQLNNSIYIKTEKQMIIIKNVDKVFKKENFIYFQALGKVKILVDIKNIYKYFCLKITSEKVDIVDLKKKAMGDLLENFLVVENAKIVKQYLSLLTKILNIKIKEDKIEIHSNNYNIPFSLTYKLNGRIKRVNVKETF